MKNLCICLVVLFDAIAAILFAHWIRKHKSGPALSTWFMFFLAGGLSLATYAVAQDCDFGSGIMNSADIVLSVVTLVAILLWGGHNKRFRPFDGIYFVLFATIVLYGVLSGDMWRSNILTQVLLVIGYGPTFHALIKQKRNEEPAWAWAFVLLAGLVAFYPATTGKRALAVIYAARNTITVSLLLAVAFYYELREKRRPRA